MTPSRVLTLYESRVDQRIAAWSVRRPRLFWRLTNQISRPIGWAVGRMLPELAVRAAISVACSTSKWLTNPRRLMLAAGVDSLDELRSKSLELSDALASRISRVAQFAALLEGVATGLGGLPLVLVDVGALMVITLNGIQRIGQCYGYALDQPEDRPYLLGILMLAGARTLPERRELLSHLKDFRKWVLAKTIESVAIESITKQMMRLALLESIPGVGAAIGAAANLAFVRQVLADGQRVFQQRWLQENGRPMSILN